MGSVCSSCCPEKDGSKVDYIQSNRIRQLNAGEESYTNTKETYSNEVTTPETMVIPTISKLSHQFQLNEDIIHNTRIPTIPLSPGSNQFANPMSDNHFIAVTPEAQQIYAMSDNELLDTNNNNNINNLSKHNNLNVIRANMDINNNNNNNIHLNNNNNVINMSTIDPNFGSNQMKYDSMDDNLTPTDDEIDRNKKTKPLEIDIPIKNNNNVNVIPIKEDYNSTTTDFDTETENVSITQPIVIQKKSSKLFRPKSEWKWNDEDIIATQKEMSEALHQLKKVETEQEISDIKKQINELRKQSRDYD